MITAAVCGVALIAFTITHKIRHGGSCCGEHEAAAAKICAADRDLSHYPYHYTAEIEGMVCARCVRNVENAFHAAEGIYAVANLGNKTAKLYAKHPLNRKEAAAMLDGTNYTLTEFKEEKT
jgi:hypothetical protein